MFRKIIFPIILIFLAAAFFYSPNIEEIAAGVAILLFGMIFLEEGFKYFTGGPLQNLLKRSTNKLYKSIGLGIVSTSVMQSSALVTVIAISFLSAGLIDLVGGIGIIFGANLGTTTGAWLISIFGLRVKISAFAMPLLIFGIILVLSKNKAIKSIGNVIAGIGFLFLGLHYMKEGFEVYQNTIDLTKYAISGFTGLIVYAVIGMITTAIMQSSHATLALILTALSTSQITYQNALALTIGANIGTTLTAIIGAFSANVEGKRLAGAHLVFNLITALFAIVFMNQIIWFVDYTTDLMHIAPDDYTLKLSMFHTQFNLIGIIVMLPLVKLLVRVLEKSLKEKVDKDIAHPKYISNAALKYTKSAAAVLFLEARHLFDNAFEIIAHGLNLHRGDIHSDKKISQIVEESIKRIEVDIDKLYMNKVKGIYSKIVEFATIAQSEELSSEDVENFHKIKIACRYIVEIVKSMKGLQINMAKYISSDNIHMKKEYNNFRVIISKIIREVYKAQSGEKLQKRKEKLIKLQRKSEQNDVLENGTLDKLIRERLITSEMATSLINDSAAVAFICKNLIRTAELLYLHSDTILLTENGMDINGENELLKENDV